jgi:hypothetical protein
MIAARLARQSTNRGAVSPVNFGEALSNTTRLVSPLRREPQMMPSRFPSRGGDDHVAKRARGAAGPRRRAIPIKFRQTNRQAQMVGQIFTSSISSGSLQRLMVRSVRLAASPVPHAHALRDFSQRSFFRRLVEPQGIFPREDTRRLQHDCVARAWRTNSIIVLPANGFSRKPTAPLACARLRMFCSGNAVMKMTGMRLPCAVRRS